MQKSVLLRLSDILLPAKKPIGNRWLRKPQRRCSTLFYLICTDLPFIIILIQTQCSQNAYLLFWTVLFIILNLVFWTVSLLSVVIGVQLPRIQMFMLSIVLANLNFNWRVEYKGGEGEMRFQLRLKRWHVTIKQRCKYTTSVDMQ